MAKKKNNLLSKELFETRSRFRKTSIGRRPSLQKMNKSKRKNFKKYAKQGR